MKRLLLVTQRPQEYGGGGSTRWRYFRRALPQHGWEVSVVSARANPTGDEFATDPRAQRLAAARRVVMDRAGALMLPVVRRVGVQPEALAPSFLWAVAGRAAVRRALAEQRPHAVLATAPPIAAHFVMAGLARELTVPLVAEFRDNWAGNPYYDAGGTVLTRIERRALEPAAAVVGVTPEMRDRLERLHPDLADRLHMLPNGFDPRVLEQRAAARKRGDGPAVIVHAGSIYGKRSIAPLLAAMDLLPGRCRLELIGPGGTPPEAEGRSDVVVRPSVQWEEAIRLQAAADVGVVLYSDDITARPGKVYELLALGVPVLALAEPGHGTANLLREVGREAGAAQHDDPHDIARTLARLLDDPPPPVPVEQLEPYDRARVAARLAALLDGLT